MRRHTVLIRLELSRFELSLLSQPLFPPTCRWNWDGVDLDACCGPNGFLHNTTGCVCKVAHKRNVSDCPPSPYYTNR